MIFQWFFVGNKIDVYLLKIYFFNYVVYSWLYHYVKFIYLARAKYTQFEKYTV